MASVFEQELLRRVKSANAATGGVRVWVSLSNETVQKLLRVRQQTGRDLADLIEGAIDQQLDEWLQEHAPEAVVAPRPGCHCSSCGRYMLSLHGSEEMLRTGLCGHCRDGGYEDDVR